MVVVVLACAGAAQAAGTISIVDIPATGSDVGSGISSSNTYTHALDFGSNSGWGSTYLINGVTFTHTAASAPGNSLSGTDLTTGKGFSLAQAGVGVQTHPGNGHATADGQMGNLLTDMNYAFADGNPMVLTLTGLSAGANYSTRIYYRPWNNDATRTSTITFNGDGTGVSTSINEDAGTLAHYVSYDFTASASSVTVSFQQTAGGGWHLYGVTNQVVPEPSSGLLLLGSAVALGLRRRRSRG